jgi:hypothetical protein
MIKIEISKSTGKATHIDKDGKKTEITNLPPQANLKAVIVRAKAMGLDMRGA